MEKGHVSRVKWRYFDQVFKILTTHNAPKIKFLDIKFAVVIVCGMGKLRMNLEFKNVQIMELFVTSLVPKRTQKTKVHL